MLELSNKKFSGNWDKYKEYVKKIRPNIEKVLKNTGWKIVTETYRCEGTIKHNGGETRRFNKVMLLKGKHPNGAIYNVKVKKSDRDKDDCKFMYALGIYRLHDMIKQDKDNFDILSKIDEEAST